MFDELVKVKKIDDPKERKVEDLKKTKGSLRRYKRNSTSVSPKTFLRTKVFLSLFAFFVIGIIVSYIIYFGIQLYINN